MESHECLLLIWRDWVDAHRRGDLAAVGRLLHPEVVWRGLAPHLFCDGRGAVLENVLARMEQGLPRVERLELEAHGERVLVGIAGPDFTEIADMPLPGEIYVLLRLEEGRVVEMRDYADRDLATEALRAAPEG